MALCAGVFLTLPRLAEVSAGSASAPKRELSGATRTRLSLALLTVIPLSLLAFVAEVPIWLVVASLVSAGLALFAAGKFGGSYGQLLVGMLLAAVVFADSGISEGAHSVLSVLAGVGCALLVARLFTAESLSRLLIAFALLDLIVVGGGLPQGAVSMISAGFGEWSSSLPIFNSISVGSYTLGSMDIAYAVLVATALLGYRATRWEALAVFGVYLLAQAVLVDHVFSVGGALPATLPGMVALGSFLAARNGVRKPAIATA